MEGEGMVAVVRGLRDAGLAVTLLDGNRQYTLLPNSITQTSNQRGPVSNSNAATQQTPQKYTADSSTEPSGHQCDRDSQAIDGRYTSIYKSMHCNVRPTSPPVQLTEFPPQRPDVLPGHGNFQVGGTGSGATYSPIRATSPSNTFRGAMSWPDRGSVCTPRPSYEVDAFANSLRKYPCLSPDRSSEIMERLINYTQVKGVSKNFSRNQSSPTRYYEQTSHHTLEPKATYTRASRSYEPEVSIRSKKYEDSPNRDRRNEHHERNARNFDVRCVRDMSKRLRDSVKASTYPYTHPVCPTIKENHDFPPYPSDLQASSNSVNMEIQAAVKMISKEVATVQRDLRTRKTVAVPDSPVSSAGEDNVEGECYFVPSPAHTSLKSIQTTLCISDINLKFRKSAQTVCSTIDLNRQHNKLTVSRKSRSQEEIKVTKDDLKRSLLELIEEVSNSEKSKNIIRDELIKKLFDTDRGDRDDNKSESGNIKRDKCHKCVSTFCPSGCDYVGDFQELVGKLRHCYGDTKQTLRSAIKPFRISEYRQLDFVLKDWINNFNLRTGDAGKFADRAEILSNVEDKIKELFKNRTKQDFDLKAGIVKILEEIPMEVNKSYKKKIYLHKLVEVLLKRMRKVVMGQQDLRVKRKVPVNRSKKILTEDDIRDFLRTHLLEFFNELNLEIRNDMLDDLENELIDVMVDSIDCIRCGHVDDASEEMELILQDLSQLTNKQSNYVTQIILQDFHNMLNNCNFNQTYMILHSNVNNSGQSTNATNDTDFSIGLITEEDLNANLDHYTNQLCQRINEWLDSLNLPQIHDRGFREVVVNDLAGDIVDRHKYIELNPNFKGTEEDELETLKYQIFKWINKLVGEENQETIGHATQLMRKINSVPVPKLINHQSRKTDDSDQKQPFDPMRPCVGETGPSTCTEENLKMRPTPKASCCYKDPNEDTCCKSESGRCCSKDTCKNAQSQAKETKLEYNGQAGQTTQLPIDPQSQADQGTQGHSESYSPKVQQSTGQTPAGKAPTGEAPTGQAHTRQAPVGQVETRQAHPGQAPTGQGPTRWTPAGQAQTGQRPGWTPSGKTPMGQATTGNAPSVQTPSGQTLQGHTATGQSPKAQTLIRQTPTGQAHTGQTPKGYTPTGQIPTGQTSMGQTPKGHESPYAQTAQGTNGYFGSYLPTDQGSPYSQAPQGDPAFPGSHSIIGQASPHSQAPQGGPGGLGHETPGGLRSLGPGSPGGLSHPGAYSPAGQISPYSQAPLGDPVHPGSYLIAGQVSPHSQAPQGSPGSLGPGTPGGSSHPGPYSPTGQTSPYSQAPLGSSGHPGYTPIGQTPAQGSPGPSGSYLPAGHISPLSQGSPVHPGSSIPTGQVTPHSHVSQGSQGRPGSISPADQSSQIPQGTYDPNGQGYSTTVPYGQFPSHAQGSPSSNFQNRTQGIPPGYFQNAQSGKMPYNQGPSFNPPYGQGTPMQRSASQDPNQQWNSPTAFSPGIPTSPLSDPAGNLTKPIYGTASERPASGRTSPGEISATRYPDMGQSTYDPSQSMYGIGLDGMAPQRFAMTPDPMRGNVSSPYYQDSQMAGPSRSAYQDSIAPIPASLRQINDDYDEYLKRWVQQIPIPVTKPSEEQSAEKARLGVYNGIWKGVTKMKLDPDIFNDPYNYQDVFDDEIEALLKNIPKTQELETSKEMLKAQLLHKTMAINAQIRSTNAPATFKQQLIETIEYNLPKRTHTVNEADPIQQQEEVDKIKLAEYYILYTRFKDEDGLKANVNKKTFLKKLGELLHTIRKTNDIDMEPNAYANEIINSLDKVPVPNMHYMRDEADDILLGFEVENWISDLPLKPDNTLPLDKRRIRDAIAMKIQDLGTTVSYADSSFARLLKTELPKFLEKIPIQPGTNIDFMIEELANRIRNLSKYIRQKSVSFQDQVGYDEFSRNMPASSSFNEPSGPKSWGSHQSPGPEDDQWHTMQTTMPPPGLLNWSGPQSGRYPDDVCNAHAIPIHTIGPGSFGGQGGVYNAQGSSVGDASLGGSCCANTACTNRSHTPSQGPQPSHSHKAPHAQGPSRLYGQSFPAVQGGQIPFNQRFGLSPYGQVMPKVQGSPTGEFPSGAQTGQLPQGSYGPGHLAPYNETFGPTSMPFGQVPQNIQDVPVPAHEIHSQGPHGPYGHGFPNLQGSPYTQDQSFGPAPYGRGPPELQGYQGSNASHPSQNPQGTIAGHLGQTAQGPLAGHFGQVPNSYAGQVPQGLNSSQAAQGLNATQPGQIHQGLLPTYSGQDPRAPSEYAGQAPQGLNATHPDQSPKGNIFGHPSHTAQGPNASYPSYISESPEATYPGQILQGPYGQTLPNQIPYKGPNAPHIGQVQPGYFGQASPNGQSTPHTGQVIPYAPPELHQDHSKDQPLYADASAEVKSNMHAPKQNQTAQSSGPVSAASQVPDRMDPSREGNVHEMAGGGLGILGVSQEPGPSTQTVTPQTTQPSQYLGSGVPPSTHIPTTTTTGFYKSTDSKDQQQIQSNQGTVRKEKTEKELKNTSVRPFDINEKEIFNIKSVQTAFSTVDIKTTKCKYCEIRSKSQEELTKITKRQEVIKRKDLGRGDLQQNVTEWFEIHSDKVKVKLWGEKMQKLAEKLKKPGGEEKLRIKIEKYLKKVPDQFSEGDDDRLDYRKQIPNDIIRKLKKMYLEPPEANLSVYRMELSKYCCRYKMENFRKVIMNWVKSLNIKKKDFLGRHVKKDEVFKYIADKLEPLVLDRPQSDSEYKIALKSNIKDFIDDLPLAISSHDKEYYVKKVTETLINEIFNIESKVPSTYIQPTIKEIKEFVKDEITFFLEKSRVAISTKRMEYLETELVDLLLDLTDIVDIDNYVVEDVTTILKEIGKLPEYKAKYFTNLLLRDYKEFFFRESFFNERGKSDHLPATYSVFQNGTGMVDLKVATSFDVYKQRLVEEITKWLSKVNICNDENMEVIVKDLASNIVDRHRYLVLNPNIKEADSERIEHLKYQVFKWMDSLFGTENTAVIEHADELLYIVNNIPKPLFPGTSNDKPIPPQNTDTMSDTKLYIEILTQEIYDWFHELPMDLQMSQDGRINTQLMKDLAEAIEKGLDKKDPEVIAKEVGRWTEKVFDTKLNNSDIEKLKHRIRSVPYSKENVEKDPKQEKVLIRSYEDIVDDWIDSIPMELKKEGLFINNRNEFIHELAVKICHIKSRLNHLPAEAIQNKLQEKISVWMKKLPLKPDKQSGRDTYAGKLVQNIQEHDTNNSTERQSIQTNQESGIDQLEGVILEWLKKNIHLQGEEYQEEIMKEIANKIDSAICNRLSYPNEDIKEYIRMLDPEQNDEFIRNMALQLKIYLQELNMFGDVCSRDAEDENLISKIEVWLKNLPLAVADVNRFENQKIDFIESMMRIKTTDVNKAVLKKEILTFMKTLPIDRYKKDDKMYLDKEASKLILSLTVEPPNISNKSQLKSNEIISNVIRDWTNTLPLKFVYCPRELRSFIDDMSSVITTLLLDPDNRMIEQSEARLHREIKKFLRRFPLQEEYSTESEISQMAEELTRTLKDINLFEYQNTSSVKNITVYGVSLQKSNITDNDFSIRSIQESDINANLTTYTRQLVQEIGIWFDNLKLPNTQREGFKEVVINDLAGDIVDRHKYLELNPDSKGTKEDELEHLKYQIFKWINKLVGEENLQTIANADDLMKRVQGIPVPMLVRPQDKHQTLQSSVGGHNSQQKSVSQPVSPGGNSVQLRNVNPTSPSASPAGGLSLRELVRTPVTPLQSTTSSNISASVASPMPTPSNCCTLEPPPPLPPPEEGTKDAIYDKYQKIFRAKCNALPIDSSTPDNAKLAELAKTGIYNGIVKTFFKLKSDPDIENDYGYFEFMLEEKIEEMLDILPQTEELKNRRHAWKLDILANAIDMLDQLHTLSDRPSFRQRVRNKFNRKFARDLELEECFLLQQGFLAEVADAYILETNYKEKDPIKANIYRNRLMKKVDDLANHLAKEHNVGFRFFKKAQLARIAMKVLEQVPIPDTDVLQGEAEEIQLADEVEKWYKELPTKPFVNDTDAVLRKRMIDLLAKKLYDIHKHVKDQSKEAKMKHEMSQFLEKRAKLQQDQDLNINFMVDQLNNRLKNNWLKEPVNYSAFEKERPLSSTFAQVDNHDFLAPLMDAAINTVPMPGQGYQGSVDHASLRDKSILQSSQMGENDGYFTQPGQSIGNASPKANYGGNGNKSAMGPSQRYISNFRQDSGQGGSPPNMSGYLDNTGMSHQVPVHSMATNTRPVLYGTGIIMSQAGPSERCVPQGGVSPRSMHGPTALQLGSSQVGTRQRPTASQSQPRSNMSQAHSPQYGSQFAGSKVGTGPVFITSQGPPMQSMRYTLPKNMRGVLQTSQVVSSPRMQNIEQNIDPNFVGQMGPQGQFFDPNMPGSYVGQDQVPFSNYPAQRMSPTDIPGYLDGHGRNSPPPPEDVMEGDYRLRCRCLEAYRRRKRCFEYGDRCSRFRPYKCPY